MTATHDMQPAAADFGKIRRELVLLCARGALVDAFLMLDEAPLSNEDATGLWEYLERQVAEAGESKLAEAVRARLATADAYTPQLAISDARDAICRDEFALAEQILRSSFAVDDMPPEAGKVLGQALIAHARHDALAQFSASADADPDAALAEVDILRADDRLRDAEARCRRYIRLHAGDSRFLVRLARICTALMKWTEALNLWEELEQRHGYARADALAQRILLLDRLGQTEEAHELLAEFLLAEPAPAQAVHVTRSVGLVNLADAILARVAARQQTAPLDAREWDSLCQVLLQSGQLGQVAWLANTGYPVGQVATEALAAARRLLIRGIGEIATQESGLQVTSPECLPPLPPHIRMRRPVIRRRCEDVRALIVNASLVSGGAERQFVLFVKALLEQGLRPDQLDLAFFSLAGDRGRSHFLPMLQDTGVRIHDLQSLPKPYDRMERSFEDRCQLLPKLLRGDVAALHHLVRSLRPSILHGWQDRAALACGCVGAFLGVEHTIMSARNMQPKKREPGNRLDGKALFSALAQLPHVTLTANSLAGVQDYAEWLGLPRDDVLLLNNGLDLKRMAPQVRKAIHLTDAADREIRLTGVFRLAHNKRPQLWLETIACLRQVSNLRIIPRIVGVGPLFQNMLEHAERLGLDGFEIEGDLVSEDEIYGNTDVVLLMSRVEGTPNVLLEAQALGIGVAACDVGGVRHAVLSEGDAAGLVLPAGVTAMEAAVRINAWLPRALAADPQARRAFVRKHFSLEALGRAALELYRVDPGSRH